MKTQMKAQPHPKKKALLLADLVGDKIAHQLIESVKTYEGWKACMMLPAGMDHSSIIAILEVNNAYKRFSRAPHIQAELQLNKILELKRVVMSWIANNLLKHKNFKQHPHLQIMLALQEYLTRRQHQIEEHLDKKQQEHEGQGGFF